VTAAHPLQHQQQAGDRHGRELNSVNKLGHESNTACTLASGQLSSRHLMKHGALPGA
jgi:hypothetical protein